MIYFTSDLHLGDAATLNLRPMFGSVEEMDRTIINNWNDLVNSDDFVYVLGDMFKDYITEDEAEEYFNKLNGNISIISGNHDYLHTWDDHRLLPDLYTITCSMPSSTYAPIESQYSFILCHYPIEFWEHSNKDSVHLHGHMHGSQVYNIHNAINGIRKFDVGVDANHFEPMSVDTIYRYIRNDQSLLPEMYQRARKLYTK